MSAYRGPVADWTYVAEADLRTYRYHIVKLATTDNLVNLATSNVDVVGVLQNAPNIGEQALVRVWGGTKLYVDGTTDVAPGDFLTADGSGHAISTVTDKQEYIARAMHPTTNNGAIIVEAFINHGIMSAA
jgi:hypothetical protein